MRVEIYSNATGKYKFEIYLDDHSAEPDLDSGYIFTSENEAENEVGRIAEEIRKEATKDK